MTLLIEQVSVDNECGRRVIHVGSEWKGTIVASSYQADPRGDKPHIVYSIQWDHMDGKVSSSYPRSVLYFLCRNCGFKMSAHRPPVARCLFGAGCFE